LKSSSPRKHNKTPCVPKEPRCITMSDVRKTKQARTFRIIIEFLEREHTASFTEIKDYVNSRLKYGVTKGRLNNILGKYPEFVKVGQVNRGYNVSEWALAD